MRWCLNLLIHNEERRRGGINNGRRKERTGKITEKDLVKHWLLGYSSETCYNYERLQALGTTNAMVPIVRRLYKTKEEQAKALKKYTVFFNTEPS